MKLSIYINVRHDCVAMYE